MECSASNEERRVASETYLSPNLKLKYEGPTVVYK